MDDSPENIEDEGRDLGTLNPQERMLLQSQQRAIEDMRQQINVLAQSLHLALEQNWRLPEYVDWEFIKVCFCTRPQL